MENKQEGLQTLTVSSLSLLDAVKEAILRGNELGRQGFEVVGSNQSVQYGAVVINIFYKPHPKPEKQQAWYERLLLW